MTRRLPLLLLAALALVGCGGSEPSGSGSGTGTTGPPTGTTTGTSTETGPTGTGVRLAPARVYFLRDERVAPAAREVGETEAVARAALEALLEGPTEEERGIGMTSEIPEGTELLDVAVADGTATVDLSGTFDDGGGSLSMRARVAQVVFTLTGFSTVERVAFRLDGEPVEAIGGEGVVVDPPPARTDFEDLTPLILVEAPLPFQTVTSPLNVHGTSNTFEATYWLSVVDATGATVYDHFHTASSGSGDRGTFDETISFEAAPGPGKVVAYERSADDGSKIHVVEIPVVLAG